MKVNSNLNYNNSFTSLRMSTYDKFGNVVNCHYTNFNREDINWSKFAKFLNERFESQDKVKISFFGCSDGSDPYTLILNLLKELGEKAKKFFPIIASDISESIVKQVNDGKIQLHNKDIEYLKKMNAMDYFERDNKEKIQVFKKIELVPFIVKDSLKDKIQTSVKDVRESVKNENYSNSVFIFRNGWTFNTLSEQNEIAKNLYKNSNKNTLVTIGQSDLFKSNASEYLQKSGFKGIKSEIFTGAETDYPSKTIGIPPTKSEYPEFILFEKEIKNV